MPIAFLWPILTVLAAALQTLRNIAQRRLTGPLGLWGASYVRFAFGLPFALLWFALIVAWRGWDGGPSWPHLGWATVGGLCQAAATALLLAAMRDRAFAAANALTKTEILGAALIGLALLGDALSARQWGGMAAASVGVALIALGGDRTLERGVSLRAAGCGVGAGLCFSVSSVCYRAGGLAWGGDAWVGAAATLVGALATQTLVLGAALALLRPEILKRALAAWKDSLVPGAAGASASALLFTAFALAPSAGVVKAVQSVDVLMAWAVTRRVFKEGLSRMELAGVALLVGGVLAVLL